MTYYCIHGHCGIKGEICETVDKWFDDLDFLVDHIVVNPDLKKIIDKIDGDPQYTYRVVKLLHVLTGFTSIICQNPDEKITFDKFINEMYDKYHSGSKYWKENVCGKTTSMVVQYNTAKFMSYYVSDSIKIIGSPTDKYQEEYIAMWHELAKKNN